jgi:hypothetical protein
MQTHKRKNGRLRHTRSTPRRGGLGVDEGWGRLRRPGAYLP